MTASVQPWHPSRSSARSVIWPGASPARCGQAARARPASTGPGAGSIRVRRSCGAGCPGRTGATPSPWLTGRRPPSGTPTAPPCPTAVLAAALLHDVGKLESGLGTFRRVGVTLLAGGLGRERRRGLVRPPLRVAPASRPIPAARRHGAQPAGEGRSATPSRPPGLGEHHLPSPPTGRCTGSSPTPSKAADDD